jgi:imidazolonepropionase-like amidohydrolase
MKITSALLLILLAPSSLIAQTGATKSKPLVFTHVTVIDMADAPPRPEMTVVVVGNRIAALGKTGKIRAPRNAQVVDASGKYLIPGLWDMHIHSDNYDKGRKYFPRLLAMGITGVRDMGSPLDDVLRLRREVDEGKLLGPRMVVCGPLLEGPLPPNFPPMPLIFSVKNVSDARQAVRSLKARGVDFIKVDSSLPRESYFAVAAEAKRQSIPFAGHIPPFVTANEASEAGQSSVEHLGGEHYGVLLACSSHESELQAKVKEVAQAQIDAAFATGKVDETGVYRASLTKPLLDSFSDKKAEALFGLFVRNRTWQTPTLFTLKGLWNRDDLQDSDIRFGEKVKERELEITKAMQRAGVGLLAGTDAPPDRANLHDELAMLVQAGLTPKEALQAATINPAKYIHRQASLGAIVPGKIADMVLLEANPLEDIGNAKRIAAVVINGRYLPKDSLQKMLAEAEGTSTKKE